MKRLTNPTAPTKIALAAALTALSMGSAMAQEAAKAAPTGGGLNLDEVVVTASPEARPKMRQSLSVSSLSADQIQDSGATSAAEILRSIPGVRAEASSGEGNANVTVRGVPISAGGSRYVQFQEDGLPVLLFGDFTFVTPDMFLRTDYGTDGLEVVRGGSASTLATNAPGGVINFLSKTGDEPGGSVGLSTNVNGGSSRRVDLSYGSRISDSSTFFLSGFYRGGEGFRETQGVNMESGGQVRGVLTKDFGGGNNAKLYFKVLDDKTPTNLPAPASIKNGKITQLKNVDPRTYSPYDSRIPLLNDPANPGFGLFGGAPGDVNKGIQVEAKSVGAEVNLDLGGGWKATNKFRISRQEGEFNGILPANYGAAGANPADLNPQTYTALYLGARFNDVGLAVNDLKASRSFKFADSSVLTATAGLFMAKQELDIDWEIGGIADAPVAPNSQSTYGPYTSFFKRNINVSYDTIAPYGALGYEMGDWNFDGSVRFDRQDVKGAFQSSGDASAQRVDFRSTLDSYSVGANYKLTKDVALFARISHGGSLPGDRVFSSPGAGSTCGNACFTVGAPQVNKVDQYEGGVKYRNGNFSTFATLFFAETDETNFDVTTGKSSANKYEANGVELESGYRMGNFRINGGVTYTNAEVKVSNDPAYVGKTPNRQARLIFQASPSYVFGPATVGASIIGTTKSRDAQGSQLEAELPAYTTVNAFGRYDVNTNLSVTLAVNNLFDEVGFTESNNERGAARSINGRSINLGLRYNF